MDRKIRTPAFAFPRVPLPLPYILLPMSIACLPYVSVIRNLFPRHWPSMPASCLCRCHLLPSRRVGGTDIATRVGWSGKYQDASRRGIAVEHDVEQGRRTRVDVTRFQWRTRGGAGVPGGAAMVREIPRRQPGAHRRGVPSPSPRPFVGRSVAFLQQPRAFGQQPDSNGVRLGRHSNDSPAFREGGLKSYPSGAGVVPVSIEI